MPHHIKYIDNKTIVIMFTQELHPADVICTTQIEAILQLLTSVSFKNTVYPTEIFSLNYTKLLKSSRITFHNNKQYLMLTSPPMET